MDAKLDKLRDRARFNSPSPDGRSSGEDAGRKLSNLLTGRRKSRGAKKNDATNSPERWGIVTADTAASGGSTPGSLVATRDQEDDEHDEDGNHQVARDSAVSVGAAKEEDPRPPISGRGRPVNVDTTTPASPPFQLSPTPSTLVTPPTPTILTADSPTFARASPTKPNSKPSSVESIRQRRAQAFGHSSKLSQSVPPPPLTPPVEETKTPGGTIAQPTNASGFFSSVLTVAQKAAEQVSSTINSPTVEGETRVGSSSGPADAEEAQPGNRRRSSHVSPMSSMTDLSSKTWPSLSSDSTGKKAGEGEDAPAGRTVSYAYGRPPSAGVSQASGVRPASSASTDMLAMGDQTPPRSGAEGETMKRSGSVRSKISARQRGRKRASSGTTGMGTSIAAGLASVGTGLSTVSQTGPGRRLTGFAVASNKRNKDFHHLFRNVPEDDFLIEDYSAALQRDILLHGRLYVSEGHICFASNILGWVTNLVISFDELISVEKKSTAVIFPNALVISTPQARNTFASLVARESTYELLIAIWKANHPHLKSSLYGVMLDDAGTGDKTEVAEAELTGGESESDSDDYVYDEDEDAEVHSFEDGTAVPSVTGSDVLEPTLSGAATAPPVVHMNGPTSKGLENADPGATGAAAGADFPGCPTHEPSHCGDDHYDRPITDVTIPAPLGKVYSMMWGPASGTFMRKWLVDDQKSRELNYPEDKTGLDAEHKTLALDYIKPLNAPIGPRQTKCITTNTLLTYELDRAVVVDCSTQTPDVPSGNMFTTKTRYCLMWGPCNSTRLVATCTIEWTGKSWLKGPIEKGANDGQIEYVKALVAALRASVTTKPPVKGAPRKGKRKGHKGDVFDSQAARTQRGADGDAPPSTATPGHARAGHWGSWEPLRVVLGPLALFCNAHTVIAVLLTVVVVLLTRPPSPPVSASVGNVGWGSGSGARFAASPERAAALEALLRREEVEMWERVQWRVRQQSTVVEDEGRQEQLQEELRATRERLRVLEDEAKK